MTIEKRAFRPKMEITPEQAEFIKENYTLMGLETIAKKYNVSISKIHKWKGELGLIGRKKTTDKKEVTESEHFFRWGSNWPFN